MHEEDNVRVFVFVSIAVEVRRVCVHMYICGHVCICKYMGALVCSLACVWRECQSSVTWAHFLVLGLKGHYLVCGHHMRVLSL